METQGETTIQVKVRVYAGLRQYLPHLGLGESDLLELPPHSSVGDLLDRIGVPRSEAKSCFVSGRKQELDYRLQEGDEVALFPPIAGG